MVVAGAVDVCVCRLDSLTVGGSLRVAGARYRRVWESRNLYVYLPDR